MHHWSWIMYAPKDEAWKTCKICSLLTQLFWTMHCFSLMVVYMPLDLLLQLWIYVHLILLTLQISDNIVQ
jgi:hypothetical protein